jgi:hypothetical protein
MCVEDSEGNRSHRNDHAGSDDPRLVFQGLPGLPGADHQIIYLSTRARKARTLALRLRQEHLDTVLRNTSSPAQAHKSHSPKKAEPQSVSPGHTTSIGLRGHPSQGSGMPSVLGATRGSGKVQGGLGRLCEETLRW